MARICEQAHRVLASRMRRSFTRLERGGGLLRSPRELLVHAACCAAPRKFVALKCGIRKPFGLCTAEGFQMGIVQKRLPSGELPKAKLQAMLDEESPLAAPAGAEPPRRIGEALQRNARAVASRRVRHAP